MSVKIVYRGRLPEHEPFRGACQACKSVIECERSDGEVKWDQREQGEFMRLPCPVCSGSLVLYPQRALSDREMAAQVARMAGSF